MKQVKRMTAFVKIFVAFLSLLFVQSIAWAQDKGIDVDIDIHKKDDWYSRPWVWVVGGAVFILLLVALLRGGKKNE